MQLTDACDCYVSFYKVNNKGGAWLGKATTDEESINSPLDADLTSLW